MKDQKDKQILIELFKETPIAYLVCKKAGISRATLYRWKKNDKEFAKQVDKALREGTEMINDVAVSQLIAAIKDKNIGAIRFWLQNNDPKYSNKLEVSAIVKREDIELTPEQKAVVKRALELATLPVITKTKNHE